METLTNFVVWEDPDGPIADLMSRAHTYVYLYTKIYIIFFGRSFGLRFHRGPFLFRPIKNLVEALAGGMHCRHSQAISEFGMFCKLNSTLASESAEVLAWTKYAKMTSNKLKTNPLRT